MARLNHYCRHVGLITNYINLLKLINDTSVTRACVYILCEQDISLQLSYDMKSLFVIICRYCRIVEPMPIAN